MKKSGGKRGSFWLLALAVLLFWGFYRFRGGFLINDSALSGEFESKVNQLLLDSGIDDADVLKSEHVEHKSAWTPLPRAWVQSNREILVSFQFKIDPLVNSLRHLSDQYHFELFLSHPQGGGTLLLLQKGKRVFQSLRLVRKKS